MTETVTTAALIEKLLFPLVIGIVGWFLKDFVLAVYTRRDEMVRKEWDRRLVGTWSPLYYWSGIVLLGGNAKGWDRHGLKELESILAASGHLIPLAHYNNLIKLVQALTEQKTTAPTFEDLKATRQYIYNQIKTFNYLLYRRSGWFEATTYTDFFASLKYFLRFASQALKHVLAWLAIVALLVGGYAAVISESYWIVALLSGAILIPILYDWEKQIAVHRALHRETTARKVASKK